MSTTDGPRLVLRHAEATTLRIGLRDYHLAFRSAYEHRGWLNRSYCSPQHAAPEGLFLDGLTLEVTPVATA